MVFETAPFDHSGTPPHGPSETNDFINYCLTSSKRAWAYSIKETAYYGR